MDGETILFAGAHYEMNLTSGAITKYYFAGASRIAMRKYTIPVSMEVEYLLGDHLGSTSLTTDSVGNKVSEIRYKPWGETRYSWTDPTLATSPAYAVTKYQYTGQFSYEAEFGLYFYNSRWYDSLTGRFAQADTLVPGGVQGLDRYAYVYNNPVRYIDPSGHDVQCTDEGCYETSDAGCNTNIPGADACKTSVVIIICGIGASDPGVCNNGDAFKDYIAKMRADGKRVEVYDVDNYSGHQKDNASNDILSFMEGVLREIPRAMFTIIGHSAGADAAILSGYKAVKAGIGNSISGIGLLDPTLTATTDTLADSKNGGLMNELLGILDAGIRVFVGDGIGAGSDEDSEIVTQEFLNPDSPLNVNYSTMLTEYKNYSYMPLSGWYHTRLTYDPGIIDPMNSFLFLGR